LPLHYYGEDTPVLLITGGVRNKIGRLPQRS
jgi:hypothetical protein